MARPSKEAKKRLVTTICNLVDSVKNGKVYGKPYSVAFTFTKLIFCQSGLSIAQFDVDKKTPLTFQNNTLKEKNRLVHCQSHESL